MRLRAQLAILILLIGFPMLVQTGQMGRVIFQIVIVREGEKLPTQEQVTVTLINDWGDVVISQDTKNGVDLPRRFQN